MRLSEFSKIFDVNFSSEIAIKNSCDQKTYGELLNEVSVIADHLDINGKKNQDLAIFCKDHNYFLPLFFAITATQNHSVCIDNQLGGELKEVLADYKIICTTEKDLKILKQYIDVNEKTIICVDLLLQNNKVDSKINDFEIDSHKQFVYLLTSGSTGTPKPIQKTLHQVNHFAQLLRDFLDTQKEDVYQSFLPFSHVYGLVAGMVLPLTYGAKIRTELPPAVLSILDHSTFEYSNVFIATPATFSLLSHRIGEFDSDQIGSIKVALTSAARIDKQVSTKLLGSGLKLAELFGTTETFGISYRFLKDQGFYHILDGVRCKQADNGVLCVDSIMTTPSVRNKDGWYYTGDIVTFNKDNMFEFQGRDGNSIKVDGNKISPIEIEDVLLLHEDVEDVAVKGITSSNVLKGEIIAAYIKSDRELDSKFEKEMLRLCSEKLAHFKKPSVFAKIEKIPRKIGKIRYRELPEIDNIGEL